MKTLEIQTLLRSHGLAHVKEYLVLEVKEKGDLVLLKYNMIGADWTKTALYDCRGIILDRSNGWAVVAFPYSKFFNLQEGYCAPIDWSNAVTYDKNDGSLITMWHHNGEWRLSTSGTIDAESYANGAAYTFAELVWKTVGIMYGSKETFLSKLDINFNYMFELMSPFNIVVCQHSDYMLSLHGARDMRTLNEVHIDDIDLVKTKSRPTMSVEEMTLSFEKMTWQDEGYIVMDRGTFARGKFKNPKYVSAHHVASGMSPYHVMSVVKTNELSEFLVYFPNRTDELIGLQKHYDALLKRLDDIYYNNIHDHMSSTDKDFAFKVFDVTMKEDLKHFSGLYFQIRKRTDICVKTVIRCYVNMIGDSDLYKYLINNK